jgi:hypothetical protein
MSVKAEEGVRVTEGGLVGGWEIDFEAGLAGGEGVDGLRVIFVWFGGWVAG